MIQVRPRIVSFLLVSTLALSACEGGDPAAEPQKPSAPSKSSSPTASPSPSAFAASESDEEAIVADLLREPGPYAGDAFALDAVVSAVKGEEPESVEAWAAAIVDATHGDYAKTTQELLDFDPNIGDDPAEPVEKLGQVEVVGQNHFAVVLDASGSMAEHDGGQTRMQQAKTAITQFASKLPRNSTLSLRVYGHKGSNAGADKAQSCAATEVVYEGAPRGAGRTMSKFVPTGWTPLAKSIDAARQDIPAEASDAIVYVVTDGIETCGGNPVEAARRLAKAGVKPVVNVIGFQVGDADQEQLRRIAKAGGGDFTDARSGADLERYWEADRRRMMSAWIKWKSKALDQINEQGRANLKEANSLGSILLSGISDEWQQSQFEVIDALYQDETLDYDTKSAVYDILYARKVALWDWSYEMKTSDYSEAYDIKISRYNEAYGQGMGKWSEYYKKRS